MKAAATKAATVSGKSGAIRIGVGGWTFDPWRETFYPKGVKKTAELHYASRQLTAIEINGTFYRLQSPSTFARWRDETPDGFVFSVKAHRLTTYRKVLGEGGVRTAVVTVHDQHAARTGPVEGLAVGASGAVEVVGGFLDQTHAFLEDFVELIRIRKLRQEIDRVLHGQDLLGGIVRDFATELFLEGHDEFDRVETVSTEVVDEARRFRHLLRLNAEMLNDDLLNALGNIAHFLVLPISSKFAVRRGDGDFRLS